MEQVPRPGVPEAPPTFSSHEEELRYLRAKVAEKEHALWQENIPAKKEAIISQTVHEYTKDAAPYSAQKPDLLIVEHPTENKNLETALGHISAAGHREKVRELYKVLEEKGVAKAVAVARAMENPHIEDDFHRIIVEYIKTGGAVPGLDKEAELKRAFGMRNFEVTLPHAGMLGEEAPSFKDAITAMERFIVGMFPHGGENVRAYGPVSFEIVLSNYSNDLTFVVAVPADLADLFLKQLLAAFPTAKIVEGDDYNLFNEFGVTVASMAVSTKNFVYPLRLADEEESDPMKVILNAFAKIERDGEGAAIQLVLFPDHDKIQKKIEHAIKQLRDGVSVKRATDIPLTFSGEFVKAIGDFYHTEVKTQKKKEDEPKKEDASTAKASERMEEKVKYPLLRANLRLVVSAATRERAEAVLSTLEAAFNQFNDPQGNGIKWKRADGSRLEKLCSAFTYRMKNDPEETIVLNTKELATLYHFPLAITQKEAPQLKTLKAATAPSPIEGATDGIYLGMNKHRGEERAIRLGTADRLRHFYVIGQTGTGKSTFLRNMIVEDMKAGNGVCFIDPHGADVQQVLAHVPKERVEDVIYFDPSYTPRPVGLNMLEYDVSHPEQKIFVVNELFAIFRQLYAKGNPESMGPAFEQYFRNATMLVLEDPETGMTMMEISRVLADKKFRDLKLSRCKNPIVVQFWREIAEKTSGEAGLANMIPYITNKFDVFLSNDVMRPIIAQEESSFNFRQIMDTKKILLVNLAKGKLGEINANLLGLILVGKIFMAAMSRVDSFGKQLPDFYMYIDEFQNISTSSISGILSEARKYGLSLTIANQFLAQIEENIKEAVFGNVGNMAVFRIGTEDAQFIEPQFAPIFTAADMMKVDNLNFYLKMLQNGKPVSPFNVEIEYPKGGHPEVAEQLKQLSYLKYGRDRATVDGAILAKYASLSSAGKSSAPGVGAPTGSGTSFASAFGQMGVGGQDPATASRMVSQTTVVTPPPLQIPKATAPSMTLPTAPDATAPQAAPTQQAHIPIAAQYPQHHLDASSQSPVASSQGIQNAQMQPSHPTPFYVPPPPQPAQAAPSAPAAPAPATLPQANVPPPAPAVPPAVPRPTSGQQFSL